MIRVSIVEDVEDPIRGSTMLMSSNFCLPSMAMVKFRFKLDHNLRSVPIYYIPRKKHVSYLDFGWFWCLADGYMRRVAMALCPITKYAQRDHIVWVNLLRCERVVCFFAVSTRKRIQIGLVFFVCKTHKDKTTNPHIMSLKIGWFWYQDVCFSSSQNFANSLPVGCQVFGRWGLYPSKNRTVW